MFTDIILYPERIKPFQNLEIHGMKFLNEFDNDTENAAQYEGENPDFYTVFIHLEEGGLDGIADCSKKEIAVQLKELIENIVSAEKLTQIKSDTENI